MRRPLRSRFAALLAAALVGLTAPGLALAHGHAHHEASEHATDPDHRHHHGTDERATEPGRRGAIAFVVGDDSSEHHGHPRVDQAMAVRAHASLIGLPALPPSLANEIVFVGAAELLITAAPARAGPPDAPPRQPRAPPLG
jgi:hypothetical protein